MQQFIESLTGLAFPIGTAIIVLVVALIIRSFLFKWLGRLAKRSSEFSEVVLRSIKGASLLWCMLAGVYVSMLIFDLPLEWMAIIDKLLSGIFIISLALVLASVGGIIIQRKAVKAHLNIQITSLAQNVVRGLIILLGALILLDTLGVKITSLLAALGVGSLAVALALQDTLSNLFSGAYIIISRHIRTGDYIKLDSGQEGYVVDIGWRATTIKPFQNTIIIIPNSKLSQSIVTNFDMPEPWIQVSIPIGVSYDTDIDKLEQVLVDEGRKAINEVPGMLPTFEPVARFMPGFGDFSLNWVFVFRVKQYVDQYFVQHELRKRILKRFQQEGIEIPFPVRTVYVRGEKGSNIEKP